MGYHSEKEKSVVVLGLARSGYLGRHAMLGVIGVEMGSSLYDKANPLGSFEDEDFAELHKEVAGSCFTPCATCAQSGVSFLNKFRSTFSN
jgi:hypothetical protein